MKPISLVPSFMFSVFLFFWQKICASFLKHTLSKMSRNRINDLRFG